jgi:hypothetical protein
MSKYGPYDEEASYPYDYFEPNRKSSKTKFQEPYYADQYEEPERDYRRYFVLKEGHLQENHSKM